MADSALRDDTVAEVEVVKGDTERLAPERAGETIPVRELLEIVARLAERAFAPAAELRDGTRSAVAEETRTPSGVMTRRAPELDAERAPEAPTEGAPDDGMTAPARDRHGAVPPRLDEGWITGRDWRRPGEVERTAEAVLSMVVPVVLSGEPVGLPMLEIPLRALPVELEPIVRDGDPVGRPMLRIPSRALRAELEPIVAEGEPVGRPMLEMPLRELSAELGPIVREGEPVGRPMLPMPSDRDVVHGARVARRAPPAEDPADEPTDEPRELEAVRVGAAEG